MITKEQVIEQAKILAEAMKVLLEAAEEYNKVDSKLDEVLISYCKQEKDINVRNIVAGEFDAEYYKHITKEQSIRFIELLRSFIQK